ncbi:MAG: transporter [Eggerthellaceae bacterium]
MQKKLNKRAVVLIALHVLLLFYSLSGIFSKNAAYQPFLSVSFVLLYGGMLAVLFIYAIGWQQIIKRLPLTVAFANKAVTVVWGIVWGVLFFGETVNAQMILGALLVIAGIVIYSIEDGRQSKEIANRNTEGEN